MSTGFRYTPDRRSPTTEWAMGEREGVERFEATRRSEAIFDRCLAVTTLGLRGTRSLDEYAANPDDSEVTRTRYRSAVRFAREGDEEGCLRALQLAATSIEGL